MSASALFKSIDTDSVSAVNLFDVKGRVAVGG
jgi:hypothetical protein